MMTTDERQERLEDIKDKIVDKLDSLLDRVNSSYMSYAQEVQTAMVIKNLADTLVSLEMSIGGEDL